MKKIFQYFLLAAITIIPLNAQENQPIYQTKAYSIFRDKVVQDSFTARILSPFEITSNYKSPEAERHSPTVTFKFSINLKDNEMLSGRDHMVTLRPSDGKCITDVKFGKQIVETVPVAAGTNLPSNTRWTIRLDMREVLAAFKEKGYYELFNGEKLFQSDFKAVYVAGSSAPLIWDFNNLGNRPELQLKDPDGDGIYETVLVMNVKKDQKKTDERWKLSKNISSFPQYRSEYPISDALYNLALDEMVKAVEPDSTFRTGKEWAGVWTRDISYSIILAMAHLQPEVARYSLLRKVKNGRIIQDTGTGGAYPVSTDRMIWAVAAWELYKVTGSQNWLQQAFDIIKNSLADDFHNAYDKITGLVKGESSFLDWREQTYPRWMQPADIYESENLGTNAVHYKANMVLADMAILLHQDKDAAFYRNKAETIKNGINQLLWLKDKGYYGQYLYGRNFKILSPRSEALGEALCIWFGIADQKQQVSIIENTPVMNYGISCIYPQIPGIPPYHNNAVWPFVQSYWALASAMAGNEQSVLESFAAVYRPAALFLTNKENFVADNGDFAGTQINSSNMLWSLSGNISLIHRILFGIEFQTDKLVFHPFVPKALAGKRSLKNFRYRNTVLDIEMTGYGNEIKEFKVDGRNTDPLIRETLRGKHNISIVLADNLPDGSNINKVRNLTSPETPLVKLENGFLYWETVERAVKYAIIRNGKQVAETLDTTLKVERGDFGCYQVVAYDANDISSFASEPVIAGGGKSLEYEVEDYIPRSDRSYLNYSGNGFIEISQTLNNRISIPLTIVDEGTYSISFRYANGNGPLNTENKCAIRMLKIDGQEIGALILPQRGREEWSNWGYSNYIHVKLEKGKHLFEIVYEPVNANMNGEINHAMLDKLILWKMN